jgi:hypothetical protein
MAPVRHARRGGETKRGWAIRAPVRMLSVDRRLAGRTPRFASIASCACAPAAALCLSLCSALLGSWPVGGGHSSRYLL